MNEGQYPGGPQYPNQGGQPQGYPQQEAGYAAPQQGGQPQVNPQQQVGYPQQGGQLQPGYWAQQGGQPQGNPNQGGQPQPGYWAQQGVQPQVNPNQGGQPQPGYWAQQGGQPQGNPQPQGYPQQQVGYPQQFNGNPQPGYWSNPQNQGSKSHVGLIIGIVVGVIVLFFVICFIAGIFSGISGASSDINKSKFCDNKWVEYYSNSYLVPKSDGTFKYYKDKTDLTDYYYTGHYKLYVGDEGIDYVVNDLSEYGVTRDEIQGLIDRNDKYKKGNFVCLVLDNEECIIDGENTATSTVTTPYYGFYVKENGEEGFDIANMNSATYYLFQPE